MKNQNTDTNKQIKLYSIIMILAGVFIWFVSDSDKDIMQDLKQGVGIFLFIVGFIGIVKNNKLSE
jgi:hypothetical protein